MPTLDQLRVKIFADGADLSGIATMAQNPLIKRVNTAFVLITDKLVELNERLVQSPHVATIEIPLPDRDEDRPERLLDPVDNMRRTRLRRVNPEDRHIIQVVAPDRNRRRKDDRAGAPGE